MFRLAPLPRNLAAALRDLEAPKEPVRLSALRDLVPHATGTDRARVVARLEDALARDSLPAVRAEAALALADAKAVESTASLVGATQDPHPRVRQLAVLALGELADSSDPAACRAIEQAAQASAPELRYQGILALGRVRGIGSSKEVLEATWDGDPQVRQIAVRVLEDLFGGGGERLPPEVDSRVRALLADPVPPVRLAAAILLGRCQDRAGEEILVGTVNGAYAELDPEDEQAAIRLTGELGIASALSGLRRRAFGRTGFSRDAFAYQARVALAQLGDSRAITAILRGLGARSWETRALAVAAAGEARLEQARPLLLRLREHPDRADSGAVDEALARIDRRPGPMVERSA